MLSLRQSDARNQVTFKMDFHNKTTRSTWTPFIVLVPLLATTGLGHVPNGPASTAGILNHAASQLQCLNFNSFQRSRTSAQGTCPIPGLLGIFPDHGPNTNAKSNNAPWSSPPNCMTLAYSTVPSPSSSDAVSVGSLDGNMYCLFTTASLHNGHGTSLIVSPNMASQLLGSGSLEDQPPPSKWLPLHNAPSGQPKSTTDAHEGTGLANRIDSTKGQGVIAARPIKQGEIIMVDYPALLISERLLQETGLEGKGHLRRRMVKRGLGQLPESTRREVMRLRGPGQYEVDAILGVNLKGLGGVGGSALVMLEEPGNMDEDDGLMGLYTEVARINHSCRPNARLRFSEDRLTMEVISYRPISAGEEILISYTPLTLAPFDRHQFLKQNYHFTCHCPLCASISNDPSTYTLAAESHSRRVRMQELYNTMLHAKSEGFYADAINILKDWFDFAQEEGLMPLMGEYHGILAELYLLLAENGSADGKTVDREATLREGLREARMAVDAWVRLGSVDSGRLEEARVLLEKIFQLKVSRRKGSQRV